MESQRIPREKEWSSVEGLHGRIVISHIPCHHSHHLICEVDEQLWFHVPHCPLPYFLLKDHLEGVGHLWYALTKLTVIFRDFQESDIQIFPFMKNEVFHMLKVWIVLFWGRLKPAYITCCEPWRQWRTVQLCLIECLLQSLLIIWIPGLRWKARWVSLVIASILLNTGVYLFHVTGICLSVQSAALTLKVAPFAFLATESWDAFKV